MPSINRKLILPTIITLSVVLSGCQFADQLKSLVSTSQVKPADRTWSKQGSVYSTTVNYESPGGQETNTFHLTINRGVITAATVDVVTQIDASIRYQNQFAKELPSVLVGKKLSDLTAIDKLSGASLTTDAFNQALTKLKAEI